MALLLGIDFGTSYFKVGLFEETGDLRGLGRIAVDKVSPLPGRSELPVDRFWQLLRAGLAEALAQAKATSAEIAGLSYSSQANTFVLLDRQDEPLTPLVIWSDRRAHPVDPAVAAFGDTAQFQRTTGFAGLGAEFAAVKWRWFQAQQAALWARTARVMTLPEYFTFALTGEAAGDASTAALTGMYATAEGGWWPAAIDFFRVPTTALCRPLSPGSPCGKTVPRARELLGLPPGVPFAVGGLDHYMAAIGTGIDRLGDASISTGTVLAALQLVDRVEPVAHCYHGPHFDGRFYRLAFDPAGAAQLEDCQRQFAPHLTLAQLTALAATVPPAAAPAAARSQDPDRRLGGMVRGIMERISTTHRTLLQRLQPPRPVSRVIATGGGARSMEWLQINADILNATVVAPRCPERACLGAAAFAAVAAGLFPKVPVALLAMVHAEREVQPRVEAVAVYAGARAAGT
ncbi:FGGY-family carbohydrate kinase [Opitutus sp. GAS368]|uniref:FGGY-family carbohydrate kinase n=1 Tax=Opitutus sp. GAS368 TaxID=1882749 RepID=UPI00087BE2F3|nr:FGGY-family carbohydrate kinase [Opitutus sp. GAS368]SDS48636.1 Sugar (pentulose or hexulose) kinase [Opitutus sp. GAS368]